MLGWRTISEGHPLLTLKGIRHRKGYNFFSALPNYHNEMEVFVVLNGQVRLHCGALQQEFGAGTICFITAGTIHMLEYICDVELVYLILEPECLDRFEFPPEAHFYIENIHEYLGYFRDTLGMVEGRFQLGYAKSNAFVRPLLNSWTSILTEILYEHNKDFVCYFQNDQVKEIFDYVMHHSEENITMESLAKRYYISASYLSHIFRDFTGKAPIEALGLARVFHATMLLLKTDTTVSRVADMCGYTSLVTFQKAFARRNGCSPSEFRKRYKEDYSESSKTYIVWGLD